MKTTKKRIEYFNFFEHTAIAKHLEKMAADGSDAGNFRDLPSMEYTITVVKRPSLYDFCKKELLKEHDGTDEAFHDFYEPVEPESWGAKEAYRVTSLEYGARNRYLLCFEDRFVEFQPDWEMTKEQMKIVGERLRQ